MTKIVALRPGDVSRIYPRLVGKSVTHQAPHFSPKAEGHTASTAGLQKRSTQMLTPVDQFSTRGPITTQVRRIGFTGFPSDVAVENAVYDVVAARALISQPHIEWAVKKLQEEIDRRKWQAELDAMLSEDEVA